VDQFHGLFLVCEAGRRRAALTLTSASQLSTVTDPPVQLWVMRHAAFGLLSSGTAALAMVTHVDNAATARVVEIRTHAGIVKVVSRFSFDLS